MKKLLPALPAIIFTFVALFSGRVHAQDLLTNGGFELGQSPGTFSQGQATYGAWTAIGNPALLGMPYAGLPVYQGTNAMHVGNSRLAGGVRQTVVTKPGVAYSLSLAVIGWNGEIGSVHVTAYDSLLQTNLSTDFAAPGGNVWSNRSSWFVATGTNTTIQIQNIPTAACTIDDVRVSETQFTGSADLGLSFSASQSTFQGGPTAGFDYSYSTLGNIGVSFRARANSGTLSAYANGTLRVGYPPTVPPNASAPITLLYIGSANGARVASDLGASVNVDGRVKFSTWLGDVNQTFPLLNKGYYLNPNKTFSPELGSTAKGSDQVHALGFGPSLDLGVGDLSATLNLEVQQNIQFTPTNLNGTLWYTNQTTGLTRQIPFSIGLGQTVTLMATNLDTAFWDFTITGLTLQNSFSNEFSVVLNPVIDYVIDTWSPGNLPIHVFGEKFPLNFNTMQFSRAFTLEAQTPQVALTSAVDVGSLVTISSPTGILFGATSPNAWFSQTTTTHDGVDTARSGVSPPGQGSWLQATFNGPGVLTYWCKVSSMLNHDFLTLDVDGLGHPDDIPWLSGEVNWQQQTVVITNINANEGTHKIVWYYTTSFYGTSGSNAAWVDQVLWTPAPLTFGRALDSTSLSNLSSPISGNYTAAWFPQTNVTHDGVDAAQSGAIGDDKWSTLNCEVAGPGRLLFWWKISAGPNDRLTLYFDGADWLVPPIFGTSTWAQVGVDIPAGVHSLGWLYDANYINTQPGGAGWVDEASFTPYPYTYTNISGKITILSYTGTGGAVTIPDTIAGQPVTTIGTAAFSGKSAVTSVTLSTNITSIGGYAFLGCTGLGKFFFPAGLTNLDVTTTFADCQNLTEISVDSDNPVYRSVNGVVFDKGQTTLLLCPAGKSGSYTVPDSITSIGRLAFYQCSLTSVQVPYGVTNIGNGAFLACTSLGSITFHRSITSIEDSAFIACGSLTALYFHGDAPIPGLNLFSGADSAIVYYGSENAGWGATYAGRPTATWTPPPPYLYTTNNSAITLTRYIGNGGAVNIPGLINGLPVTSIGSATFINQGNVTSVTIPNGVTDIGDAAFSSCTGLTNVIIPATVTNIGISAFRACTNLTAVTVPSGVTSIEDGAFSGCTRLANVTIPSTVTSLGSFVFQNCPSLTSLTIPGSVSSLGDGTFYSCANLTSVYFTGNAPTLGTNVFLNDTNLPPSSATVFRLPNTTGWGATFGGRPTALWRPQVQISDASFGIRTNQFGFNITWTGGSTVVVETCTNLANPIWLPLKTNIMIGGSAYFSDPTWTNHAVRYYRLRWP
jgi:hypothetical protein